MHHLYRRYLLLCFVIVNMMLIKALDYRYSEDVFTKFRNITTHDGLSHNRILDIKQDQYGFIWIATRHGLNRYDGYEFKHYYSNKEDSTSLPGNYVTSIDFDYYGHMWVGTRSGMARYIPEYDSFDCFCIFSTDRLGLSDPYVRCLMGDTIQPVLWVETVDGVLNRINLETNEIEHFRHDRIVTATYDYHELFRDRSGNLWIGGRDMGPFLFDEKNQSFHLLPQDFYDPQKKRDKDIASIYQDQDSMYWMSATDGFYQYFPHSNTFTKHHATSTFDIVEEDCFYLWLGTGDGLERYHKYNHHFTSYRHNPNEEHSLINNHIHVLLKDKDENLWIGTSKGISVMYNKDVFTHYRHIPETPESMPFDYVRHFMKSDKDKVWLATHGGGVIEWDITNDSFSTLAGTENQRISTLYRDSRGDTWMGMWSGTGFLRYAKNGKVDRFALDYNSTKRDWYHDFYEDKKGRLMVGVWGSWGVHYFDRDHDRFEAYTLRLPEAHTRTHLKSVAIQEDKVWGYWYSSVFHRYDPTIRQYEGWGPYDESEIVLPEWKAKHFYHHNDIEDIKIVHQITEDQQLDLTYWCTNVGLLVFENDIFQQVKTKDFSEIYGMSKVQNGHYYLTTDNGLFSMNQKDRSFKRLNVGFKDKYKKVFTVDDKILLLIAEKEVLLYNLIEQEIIENNLNTQEQELLLTTNEILVSDPTLIGTNNGLIVLQSDKSNYTLYNMSAYLDRGLLSNKINGIIQSDTAQYWLATDKGLLLFDRNNEHFTLVEESHNNTIYDISQKGDTLWMATHQGLASYNTKYEKFEVISNMNEHKLSSHLINFIEEDMNGNLWVGTSNRGVNMIDTSNYLIHQFMPDNDSPKGFWGVDAQAMAIADDGLIYISSDNGLNIYHSQDSSFEHITSDQGLPSNDLSGLAFDDAGILWGVSSEALWAYNTRSKKVLSFGEDWGFNPFRFSGAIAYIDGQLLLGSDHGFYAFNPQDLLSFDLSQRVGFTGLKVFSDDKPSDFLKTNRIRLNYDENFFTISFSDFDFSTSGNTYYYKLDGIDPDWVKTTQNYAAYTNIKPGEYKLLLTTESNRLAQLTPTSIGLVITPPYWKKPWFIFLEIILALAVIYFIYQQKIKSFKQREKHLMTEQKLLRSQMNPHFVFNALIAIQSFIFMNEAKEAGRYLSKFAKLMRQFLQNTRQDFILLSLELETLEHYMELQRLRFDNAFDYTITCEETFDPEEIKIPPMMAQPFIENAIEHGFKNIKYKGKITINYTLSENAIEISIKDNGIGIKQSAKDRKHKSLATVITRERLKNLSKNKQKFSLNIIDLIDTDAKGSGTIVNVSVPYINAFNVD